MNSIDKALSKEVLVVAINFRVVEFNQHYCVLSYDNDRSLKFWYFEDEYKNIKKYYEVDYEYE